MSIILFLIMLVVAGGPNRVKGLQSCDLSDKLFVNISDLLESVYECTFLTDKLNSSCVSAACPQLSQSGACPLTATGNVNQTATDSFVRVINTCLEKETVICDVTMARTPMPFIRFSMTHIFVNLGANGTCSYNPGTHWVDNLSSARVTSAKGTGLTLNLKAQNLTYYAHFTCDFSWTLPKFITLPLLVKQTLPLMFGYVPLNITSTVTFDRGTFQLLNSPFDISVTYSNFTDLDGIKLPPVLVDAFNEAMTDFLKRSTIASTPINFLSLFINYALQEAQKNCA